MTATIGCGLLSFAYLWSISQKNVPLAIVLSMLMWGIVYQGQNAVYPAFYPEQFPTKTRVTGMAIGHNLGTAGSSAMAFVFPPIAPPGSGNVPLVVGGVTLLICLIAFTGAYLSPETYRLRAEDLGVPGAQPIPEEEYLRRRQESIDRAKAAKVGAAV